MTALFMFLQVFAAFYYIENYEPVPQKWMDVALTLCDKGTSKNKLFHYHNLITAGYYLSFPVLFLTRLLFKRRFTKFFRQGQQPISKVYKNKRDIFAVLFKRQLFQLVVNLTVTYAVPKLFISGSPTIAQDLILKKTFPAVAMWALNNSFVDTWLR